MKILVFSDSHGETRSMLDAVSAENPGLILHLGDHERDCLPVRQCYPSIPCRAVRGNCDRRSGELDDDEFVIAGKRIFMTHGHLYGVKTGLYLLKDAGLLRQADIILFGHTHRPYSEVTGGVYIINPGSVGRKTYAVLQIEHGTVEYEIKTM